MKVLVIEPQKPCRVQEIDGLAAMQQLVGGSIEAVYPFQEPVALVCNAGGKNLGLQPNRLLKSSSGRPYDYICGTFFVAGLGTEEFTSLTENQIQQYKALFDRQYILSGPTLIRNQIQRKRGKERIER